MPNSNPNSSQAGFLSAEVDAAAYEKILRRNNFAGRTISEVLKAIARIEDNNHEKGTKFEKLTQWALPLVKSAEIEIVKKPLGQDIGADLIATDTNGKEIAIQCKFYTSRNIRRNDFVTFLAAANRRKIKTKWLVCGGRGISDEAKNFIKDEGIQVVDLRQYGNTILTTKPQEYRAPLPLQEEAINAVVRGFTNAKPGEHGDRRGKLIMACGTGKTFTALRIAEQLTSGNANILFIAPSIALVAQARKEWLDHTTRRLRTLIICSDQTAGHDEDIQPNEITGRVTTAPSEIAEVLTEPLDVNAAQATFCTYQSLGKLLKAQTDSDLPKRVPKFDLAIIDEAHRTTGLLKEEDEEKIDKGQFLLIHDAKKIKADMRLYMTATPRIYKDNAARRKAEKDPGIAVVDMSDSERYGNQFHHLTFKKAVNADILCDYRVIGLGVSESVIGPRLTNTLLALNDEVGEGLTTRSSKKGKAADAQAVLALGAISLAINGFIKNFGGGESYPEQIARTIAFAGNIRRSRWLMRALQEPQMKSWATKAGRRPDSDSAKALTIDARHLDGTSSASARYDGLAWLSGGGKASPRLITNAQLFTEGVDVPALNAIAFLDPRQSKIDTVQAVGRVMRRDPDNEGKVFGYIIVPVIMPPGSSLLDTLENDKARFRSLGNVLRALRSHDERFTTEFHLLLGEAVTGDGDTRKDPPADDLRIQQTFLDDETKQAIFAQLANDTGIGNAGKNTADDITVAINRAAAIFADAGVTQLIAKTIGTPSDNALESCKTAALLIVNACIMHVRLNETGNLGDLVAKIDTANTDTNPPAALHSAWRKILQKDYSPIFQDAALLVKRMAPLSEMHQAINVLIECAISKAGTLNDLGFDHAGHLYHRVLGTAQSDGAFYTKNLSAYLLAGLAFDDDFTDWSDEDAVRRLRIADPACGTGTLLMAALNTIKRKAAKAQNLTAEQTEVLHKHLVENAIHGFDINKYSIQLAACNLTIGAPNTDYSGMNLHTLQHGPLPDTAGDKWDLVRHGALEILLGETGGELLQDSIADPDGIYSTDAERKRKEFHAPTGLDAVIYNPPFTGTSRAGTRFNAQTKRAMDKRLKVIKSELQSKDPAAANAIAKMSIQPYFTPLTIGLLHIKGKLAKIIPATVCTAENARTQRQYLAKYFHIEMVVTSHDPKHINFSENTDVHECLLIGKRITGTDYDKPTRFIQLAAYPNDVKQVEKLIDAIQNRDAEELYTETLWPEDKVRAGNWTPVQWFNSQLAQAADEINNLPNCIGSNSYPCQQTQRSVTMHFDYADHANGNCFSTLSSKRIQTIQPKPNALATAKLGHEKQAAKFMREKADYLLLNFQFDTNSGRVIAIYSDIPMISTRHNCVGVHDKNIAKSFAAFLNSSFGLIQMLNVRTTKLTYPTYPPAQIRQLRLPDPNKADLEPLLIAFEKVKDTPLERLANCAQDPARKILDHAAAKSIGVDPAVTDQWREWLSQEPTITNKPYQPQ